MKILSSIVGAIALILWVSSIQLKKKDKIIKMQMVATTGYAIQYFLLSAFSAGVMNLISAVRSFIFYRINEKGKDISKWWLILFVTLILSFGIVTYTDIYSLIPIQVTLLYTIGTWQKNVKILRIIFLFEAFVWIFYNYKVGAYVAIVGNTFEIISGITSIWRYRKDKIVGEAIE